MGLVYLVHPVECKENMYKIGYSDKEDLSRLNSYKKGSDYVLFYGHIMNPRRVEAELIRAFEQHFVCSAGREFFDGDQREMVRVFHDVVMAHYQPVVRPPPSPPVTTVNYPAFATFFEDCFEFTDNESDRLRVIELYEAFRMHYREKNPSISVPTKAELVQYIKQDRRFKKLRRELETFGGLKAKLDWF